MAVFRLFAITFCLLASGAALAEDPLPRAKPEEVGMSSERLARIATTLKADIDAGRIPGAVIAIRSPRQTGGARCLWLARQGGRRAMTTDTIFNIASMTKPMVTVGALMLYEQGKLLIDDPLSKYFPKFATMRVAVRDAAGEPTVETAPANRQITIQDLMRHTSGLIYGAAATRWCTRCIRLEAAMRGANMTARLLWTSWLRCLCCISQRPCGITALASTFSASRSKASPSRRSDNICNESVCGRLE